MMIDDDGFWTGERRVAWSEVRAAGIRTTAEGPWSEDLFWIFLTPDGAHELPGSLVGGEDLGIMARHLPGLDMAKVIAASGSTEERVFRLWHVEESSWRLSDDALGARFVALVARLGGRPEGAPATWARLRDAWGAAGRRYHGLEHLTDCLGELDRAAASPEIAGVAELALVYHDAVYEPRAGDGEERSAERLLEDAAALGIPRERAREAAACVRATAHVEPAREVTGASAELVVDVDLAILGRDPLRFLEYEHAVSEEHVDVPHLLFRVARGRFLAALLREPAIFRTTPFRERYERAARANIAALLASPRYRAHRWLGPVARLVAGA